MGSNCCNQCSDGCGECYYNECNDGCCRPRRRCRRNTCCQKITRINYFFMPNRWQPYSAMPLTWRPQTYECGSVGGGSNLFSSTAGPTTFSIGGGDVGGTILMENSNLLGGVAPVFSEGVGLQTYTTLGNLPTISLGNGSPDTNKIFHVANAPTLSNGSVNGVQETYSNMCSPPVMSRSNSW
jgi:hypothetical protein